jgi:hypothetical protein
VDFGRSFRPPSVSIPLQEPAPPPAKSALRFALPVGIALSLAGAAALIVAFGGHKSVVPPAPEVKPAAAARPTVEILPAAPGTQVAPTDPELTGVPKSEPKSAPKIAPAPEEPGSVLSPRDPEPTASKKKPTSEAEKRAILRNHSRPKKHLRSTVNGKNPRPNPF